MSRDQTVNKTSSVSRQSTLLIVILVFFGGAIGSLARELLVPVLPAPWFWVPVLLVNLIACFFIGWLFVLRDRLQAWLSNFLVIGFCGGFSTFSHFSFELVTLGDAGDFLQAVFYVVLAVVLGIGAAVSGEALAQRVHRVVKK